ncbi:MAG: hypothetical protein SOS98_02205 [Varibaculum sp.]|nr:hypothetical protein [Varibaculum sp.]
MTSTKINRIKIGSGPALKLGVFSICPIPVGGGVFFNPDGLGNIAKKLIFLSGPLVSVVLAVISALWNYPGHRIVEIHAFIMIALSTIGSDSDLNNAFRL